MFPYELLGATPVALALMRMKWGLLGWSKHVEYTSLEMWENTRRFNHDAQVFFREKMYLHPKEGAFLHSLCRFVLIGSDITVETAACFPMFSGW